MRKYQLPQFLAGRVTQTLYDRWLSRKAIAHVKRDRKRDNFQAVVAEYKKVIHQAVEASGGLDAYTGEQLDWHLLSEYNNEESKAGRRLYKAKFALLPTVDHVGDGSGVADFRICGWQTNDAKHDLSHSAFVDLCRRVVSYSERHTAKANA